MEKSFSIRKKVSTERHIVQRRPQIPSGSNDDKWLVQRVRSRIKMLSHYDAVFRLLFTIRGRERKIIHIQNLTKG